VNTDFGSTEKFYLGSIHFSSSLHHSFISEI